MSERLAGWLAGAALVTAATGACAALTTIPAPVMFATGIVIVVVCMRSPCGARAAFIASLLAGAAVGFALPTSPPPAPGRVATRGAGMPLRGDLFDVLDRLDDDPAGIVGRAVSVAGQWAPASTGADATVSRRVVNCCAADAVALGFDVEPVRAQAIASGAWVRVTGVVTRSMHDGEVRFVLMRASVSAVKLRSRARAF
jgi:hypothetical protein